jgi:hypothetical protein
LRTISDIEPIRFGQGNRLSRFHPGSKAGQGDNGRSQQAKDGQARERFDHLKLLTGLLADPAALGDHVYNIHRDKEFLSFVRKRMIVCIIEGKLPLSREAWMGQGRPLLFCHEPTARHSLTISTFRSDHPGKAAQNSAVANCAAEQPHWGREPILRWLLVFAPNPSSKEFS